MWIVCSNEDGIYLVTDDYEEALEAYEKLKGEAEQYVNSNGYFECDEDVILAKIDKRFFAYETENKVEDKYENYWDFKEFSEGDKIGT